MLRYRFPLAWGVQSAGVDAFVTGSAEIAPDRRSLSLHLLTFDWQDDRLPPPGSILTRTYKGDTVQVKVLTQGFEYQGVVYPSLSAAAKAPSARVAVQGPKPDVQSQKTRAAPWCRFGLWTVVFGL